MKTVLLIEGYDPLRVLYEELFRDAGYQVNSAGNFEDALPVALSFPPDVVVCDSYACSPREYHDATIFFGKVNCPTVVNSSQSIGENGGCLSGGNIAFLMKSSNYFPLLDEVHRLSS